MVLIPSTVVPHEKQSDYFPVHIFSQGRLSIPWSLGVMTIGHNVNNDTVFYIVSRVMELLTQLGYPFAQLLRIKGNAVVWRTDTADTIMS